MKPTLIASCLAIWSLTACGKDGSGPGGQPSVTGDWQGMNGSEVITMSLTQSGGSITGTGLIHNQQQATTLTLTGSHAPPFVNMHFDPVGFVPWDFSGRLTADTLKGVFNGSGFSNFGVVFRRQ